MKKVFLVRPNDYDANPRYNVDVGESPLNSCAQTHATVQAGTIPNISTHALIYAHHPLGGGNGGWESYDENIRVVRGTKVSPRQLTRNAREYAQNLATRLGTTMVDLSRAKRKASV